MIFQLVEPVELVEALSIQSCFVARMSSARRGTSGGDHASLFSPRCHTLPALQPPSTSPAHREPSSRLSSMYHGMKVWPVKTIMTLLTCQNASSHCRQSLQQHIHGLRSLPIEWLAAFNDAVARRCFEQLALKEARYYHSVGVSTL